MAKETTTTGGARGGIAKPVTPSADLAKITGSDPLPRSEVVSKMWEYIKKHDLQAKDDKRQIEPDDKLGKVIGKERISMFKMTAAISKHIK